MSQNFYNLNKSSDWSKGILHNLEITDDELRIKTGEQFILERQISSEELSFIKDFTDMAVDKNDILYILDKGLNLWTYDSINKSSFLLFGKELGLFTSHSMISVIKNMIIIADPFSEFKLKAVSIDNGQIVWTVSHIGGHMLIPLALTCDEEGNSFVISPKEASLDHKGVIKMPEISTTMIVGVNTGGVVYKMFGHNDLEITKELKIEVLRDKYFIKAANDKIYVLESEFRKLKIFSISGEMEHPAEGTLTPYCIEADNPYCIEVDSRGVLYIGELYTKKINELNLRNIKMFGKSGESLGELPSFGGKFNKLLIGQGKKMFVPNYQDHFITVLRCESNIFDTGETGLSKGVYITPLLDSFDNDTVWHRFIIDAQIPEDTQFRVSYFSCDDLYIKGQYGSLKIDEFLKNSKISYEDKMKNLESLWLGSVINPRDALILKCTGKKFCMKIEFIGSQRKSPVLRGLKVVYPRRSYIRYLPGIYQRQDNNLDFLERFLSIFETVLMEMENKIDNIARCFDINTVDEELARWLGSWLGIEIDSSWDEMRLKKLVTNAPEILKRRGTCHAIKKMIEIYTGEKPLVVEQFQLNKIEKDDKIKQIFERLYGTNEFVFYVLLKPWQIKGEAERAAVENILISQKPAHTQSVLILMQPRIYLDKYSYLGINSYISKHTPLKIQMHKSIPNNTVLIEKDRKTRLERHSRIDTGIRLN